MADVINFPDKKPAQPKEPETPGRWACGCGCVTHYLYDDGTVRCARCGADGTAKTGAYVIADAAKREALAEGLSERVVIDHADAKAAFEESLNFLRHDTAVAAIVIQQNGDSSSVWTWGHGNFPEEKDRIWLTEQMQRALNNLIREEESS